MDFEQKKRQFGNEKNYHLENLRIARNFSKEIITEMKDLVRSIVLFGSNSKNTQNKNSDVDIMVVLDNVSVFVSPELREAYHVIVGNLTNKISNKLHILTMNLSDLWDMARKGDPVLINILRFGVPLFDRDLVEPLQYLLEIGKIKPTRESMYNYISRSKVLLDETKNHLENAVLDLYYSVVDIVHSVLIMEKITPPSPKDMPAIYSKAFKGKKIENLSKEIEFFYDLAKKIEYRNLDVKIDGKLFDGAKKKAEKIVSEIDSYIREEIKDKDNFEL
ncbi:MAG: nucleotidyltransferase domain-containing protein [Nanoarchaeota archaeon]